MNAKEMPIFICEPPFTPKSQKKELCSLLFENYDFPSVFFGTQGVLSLYAFGKQNGLMVESGEGVTQVVPIYNGYKLDHAVERVNLGGEDVTNYLKILLRKNGVHIHSQFDNLIFQDIKGNLTRKVVPIEQQLRQRECRNGLVQKQHQTLRVHHARRQ